MILTSSFATCSGERIKSGFSAVMAFLGMSGYCAVAGSCAKVIPPSALIALNPSVPSFPSLHDDSDCLGF